MRILKDKDWNLIGIQGQDGFIFRHKSYDDILLVKRAKFVLTKEDVVFFCDIDSNPKMCLSYSSKSKLMKMMPSVNDIIDDAYALLSNFGYDVKRLTAINGL